MSSETKRPLILYDGTCRFCTGGMTWVRTLDWRQRFELLANQSDEAISRYPPESRQAWQDGIHVLLPDGRHYTGGPGITQICWRLPLTMPIALILSLPGIAWVWKKTYPIIARYRKGFAGSCELPPAPY